MGIERVLVAQWSVLLHARSRAAHGECHAAESSHGGDSALNARFGAAGRSAHFERFPPARVRRRAPAGVERLLSDWSRMIRRRGCRTWGRDRREIAGHESIADRARHPPRPGGIALAVGQESAVVSSAADYTTVELTNGGGRKAHPAVTLIYSIRSAVRPVADSVQVKVRCHTVWHNEDSGTPTVLAASWPASQHHSVAALTAPDALSQKSAENVRNAQCEGRYSMSSPTDFAR